MESSNINNFIQLLTQGDFSRAHSFCNEILKEKSNDHILYNFLGVIYLKFKVNDKGLDLLNQAIKLKPDFGEGYKNIGIYYLNESPVNALEYLEKAQQYLPNDTDITFLKANIFIKLKKYDLARKYYLMTLELNPKHLNAMINLGALYYLKKEFLKAIEYFNALNKKIPNNPGVLSNLAISLSAIGKLEEAEKIYKILYSSNPRISDYSTNYCNLCIKLNKIDEAIKVGLNAISTTPENFIAHNNLGYAYYIKKDYKKAEEHALEAIKYNPHFAEAYNNLGNICIVQNKLDKAKFYLEKALEIDPKIAKTYFNFGNVFMDNDVSQAISYYKKAIEIEPTYIEAYNNLATLFIQIKDYEESEKYNKLGLQIDPESIGFKLNLARLYLALENFSEGWRLNEARLNDPRIQKYVIPKTNKPMWDGSSLKDKTIYTYCEQGLGDTINFIRYIPLLESMGAKVILKIQDPLYKLYKNSSLNCRLITDKDQIPLFDAHIPLMSVPRFFTSDQNTIPDSNIKFDLDETTLNRIQKELFNTDNLKIGISWQGNKNYSQDKYRSTKLEYFKILSEVDNVSVYSLYNSPNKEEQELLKTYNYIDLSSQIHDFYDTGCIIHNMDLIICVDTSIIHLAGSLNKKTFLLLGSMPDWRWFTNTDKTNWYKSVTLFRQQKLNDWMTEFEAVIKEIPKMI